MKKISKIFVALLFVCFLVGCQSNDISSSADQSLISSSSENSEKVSEESSIKKLPSDVFYFTAICDYMKELSDYRNPDYMQVSTERTGSDKATVRGEKCYMILSLFDNIQLQYYVDDFYSLDFNPTYDRVGDSCPLGYCFNCHVYATLGMMIGLDVPSYYEIRDRVMNNGKHWIKEPMRKFIDMKLYDNAKRHEQSGLLC